MGKDTDQLARQFIDLGFQTTICAANADLFNFQVAGKLYDKALLEQLPKKVDPCGENGEFHSFVHAGPLFKKELKIETGEVVTHSYEFKDDQGNDQTSGMEFVEIRIANV